MKTIKLKFTVLILFCISFSYAQKGVIINQGVKMVLNEGAVLVISDDLGLINNSNESIFDGTVVFSGNALQEIGGTENCIFSILEIDNINGVFLNNNSRITEQLMLTSGVFDLTDFNLTLNDISTISGTFSSSNMINVDGNGVLIKEISNNEIFTLPIGDLTSGADYSPIDLVFNSGNYSNANISVGVKNEKHPDNLSTTDYLNRYWTISSSGISNFSCDMTFNYVPGDIVGNESNIYGAIRENTSWHSLGQASSNQFAGTVDFIADVTGLQSDQVGIFDIYNEQIDVSYHSGNIFIKNNNDFQIISIEIYDTVGKQIDNLDVKNTGYEEIPFRQTTGYYFLKLNTEKAPFVKKIFVN